MRDRGGTAFSSNFADVEGKPSSSNELHRAFVAFRIERAKRQELPACVDEHRKEIFFVRLVEGFAIAVVRIDAAMDRQIAVVSTAFARSRLGPDSRRPTAWRRARATIAFQIEPFRLWSRVRCPDRPARWLITSAFRPRSTHVVRAGGAGRTTIVNA